MLRVLTPLLWEICLEGGRDTLEKRRGHCSTECSATAVGRRELTPKGHGGEERQSEERGCRAKDRLGSKEGVTLDCPKWPSRWSSFYKYSCSLGRLGIYY